MAQKREALPLAVKAGADGDSRLFSSENLINMFPEAAKGQAISGVKLVSSPGEEAFATIGGGAVRGLRRFGSYQYAVVGEALWTLPDGSSTPTQITSSPVEGSAMVEMGWNRTQIGILGDARFYIYLPSTGVLTEVTDPDLTNPISFDVIDSYGLLVEADSDTFQVTDLADFSSVEGLSFAAAESSPDELKAVRNVNGDAFLFGADTVEAFTNTGDTDSVFQRSTSAKPMNVGALCRDAIQVMDNTVYWLGRQAESGLVVFKANGYQPERVSTHSIETWLEKAGSLASNARAFAQSSRGHLNYVLTIPGHGTRCLDMATKEWHQRADGTWPLTQPGAPAGDWGALAFSPNGPSGIIGRGDGNLYRLSHTVYDQDGEDWVREFVLPPFYKGGKSFSIAEIEFLIEAGVGLTDTTLAASDPQLALSISVDGGNTWSRGQARSLGQRGVYVKSVIFTQLGWVPGAKGVMIKGRCTDAVPLTIAGAFITTY